MTTTTALVLALSTLALLSCAHARPHNASFGLLGHSMHMQLVSGNSSVDVRLGKVYEQTANGMPVPGHRLPSLASLQPAVTNGTKQLNGTTLNYVTLSISNLAGIPNFDASCPAGAAPPAVTVPLAAATINVTFFYNISANVSFPYGDTLIDVAPGAVKFNIDAAGWPFCSADNQLMLELALATSTADDEPVLFDDNAAGRGGDDDGAASAGVAPTNTTVAPSSGHRRLLEGGRGRGGGSETGQAVGSPLSGHGGNASKPVAQQGQRPGQLARPNATVAPPHLRDEEGGDGRGGRRDPSGRKPRLIAALLSADAAAALDLQTVAYDAAIPPTVTYNVSVYAPGGGKVAEDGPAPDGGAPRNVTRYVLGFPYFNTTLHYDPTVAVEEPASLGYANTTTADAATTAVSAPASNGAGAARVGAPLGALAHAALGAAALVMFMAG